MNPWICLQCGAQNAADEDFCLGCGVAKPANATASAPATGDATSVVAAPSPAPTPTPSGTVVRTLLFGDKKIPLVPGKFAIASNTVQADLGLPGDDISSAAFVLEIGTDGSVIASYSAVEGKAWAVIKDVDPNEKVSMKPGDRIVAGETTLLMLL